MNGANATMLNPEDLFEDFELLIVEAIANGTEQSKLEFSVFLSQVYEASRAVIRGSQSEAEIKRSKARGRLIALLGALQNIAVSDLRERIKSISGTTPIIEVETVLPDLRSPYALLLYTDEFPLSLLLAVPHFASVINISSKRQSYVEKYFTAEKFSNVRCLFHPSLALETRQLLSSTAEPFTPLILIDPFIDSTSRQFRDNGSIIFDCILQLTFIDEFNSGAGPLDRNLVRAKMYVAGAAYAEDLFNHQLKLGMEKDLLSIIVQDKVLTIVPGQVPLAFEHAEYCVYLASVLFKEACQKALQYGGIFEKNIYSPYSLAELSVALAKQ